MLALQLALLALVALQGPQTPVHAAVQPVLVHWQPAVNPSGTFAFRVSCPAANWSSGWGEHVPVREDGGEFECKERRKKKKDEEKASIKNNTSLCSGSGLLLLPSFLLFIYLLFSFFLLLFMSTIIAFFF